MLTCKVVHVNDRIHGAIYIGRPSEFGNPFSMKDKHDTVERRSVCQQFANYLRTRKDLLAKLPELRGKTLACYCCHAHQERSEFTLCHGHVIQRFLAEYTDEQLLSGLL